MYSINTRVHVWHIGNLGWVVRPPDHPSPKDDVRVVVVLERRLFVVAAAVWLLLLEEAPRLLGLAAVGPRAARRHRARRRTRLPAAVPGAARDGDLPVAVDEDFDAIDYGRFDLARFTFRLRLCIRIRVVSGSG